MQKNKTKQNKRSGTKDGKDNLSIKKSYRKIKRTTKEMIKDLIKE